MMWKHAIKHSACLLYVLLQPPGIWACLRTGGSSHLSPWHVFEVLLFWVRVGRTTCQNAAERASFQPEFLIFKANIEYWSAAREWRLFCIIPHDAPEPSAEEEQQPRQHWMLWPRLQGQNVQNLAQTPRFSPDTLCSSASNFPRNSQCPIRPNLDQILP